MFRGLLRDKDGNTDELVFFGLVGISAYILFTGYDLLWLHNAFSAASWSMGFASIIGATGAAVGGRNMMNGRDHDVRPELGEH